MNITEAQVFEVLGVGEKAQESAVPAEETQTEQVPEGERVQEPAAPAETGSETEMTETEPAEGQDKGADAPTQSEAERRENAARRRREEQQAAIDAAVEAALRAEREKQASEQQAFFAAAGLKNTITGEAITDMDGFNSWKKSFDEARLQNELKSGKLTRETLNGLVEKAVADNPIVQQARAIVEQQKQTGEQQRMEALKAQTDAELAEIRKMDPSIGSLQDILQASYGKQFYDYVQRGNSFADAFYLANRERLTAEAAERAKTQAISNARSKDHLSPTAGRGPGGITVSAAEMQLFKALNPTATEAEIQNYLNKYRK